jgi:glycine cleavage system H lipoate-binding protein
MFPGVFDFQWSPGHVIFLGAFFCVLACVLIVLSAVLLKTLRDFRARRVEAIRWDSNFHDLSAAQRRCRHELTARIAARICPNGFDCRQCDQYDELAARPSKITADDAFGFDLPQDRLYHRGHAWVKPNDDGTVDVGLDDFGARLIGDPDAIDLPAEGSRLEVNGTGWTMTKGGQEIRVLSPVEGTVVATGGPGDEWLLRVKPPEGKTSLKHLLRAEETCAWLLREVERLQQSLSPQAIGVSLADGGQPVRDLTKAYPQANWDAVWGEVFLEG